MPRRGQIAKRDVLPDPLYNSKLVTRLINNVMYDGKRVSHRRSCTTLSTSSKKRRVMIPWKLLKLPWRMLCPYWRLRLAV